MKQKEVPEMDDVEEIISKISEDSPYKRRPTQKRTWATAPETLRFRTAISYYRWEAVFPSARLATITRHGREQRM